MVPRRGTSEINTSVWKCVVGAWNNSIRIIRAISKSLGQEPPLIIKGYEIDSSRSNEMG